MQLTGVTQVEIDEFAFDLANAVCKRAGIELKHGPLAPSMSFEDDSSLYFTMDTTLETTGKESDPSLVDEVFYNFDLTYSGSGRILTKKAKMRLHPRPTDVETSAYQQDVEKAIADIRRETGGLTPNSQT